MERLTKRNSDGSVGIAECRYYNYEDFQKLAQKLADYEDKEEKGLIAQCTCGDCIHVDCTGCSGEIVYCMEFGSYRNINDSCNKAEAESALAKMGGK